MKKEISALQNFRNIKNYDDSSDSLEHFLSNKKVQKIIETKIRAPQEEEIKTNKRTIDKWIFDPISKVIPLKKRVYKYYQSRIKLKVHKTQTRQKAQKPQNTKEKKNQQQNIEIQTEIPKAIQNAIKRSIEKYPELSNTKVKIYQTNSFKIMKSKQHVMRTQVVRTDFLKSLRTGKKTDRTHTIVINTLEKEGVIILNKLGEQEIYGVMMHEFAHLRDYTQRSNRNLLGFFTAFALSPKWVREMEHKTDETAIARGAGRELHLFRKQIVKGSKGDYIKYKKRTYMDPEQILYAILKYHKQYSSETIRRVIKELIR